MRIASSVPGRRAPSVATVVVASAAVLLTASAARPGPAGISVQLSDTGIKLSKKSVPAGKVTISLHNRSSVRRDFSVVGAKRTPLILPGKKVSLTVTFSRTGERILRSVAAPGARGRTLTSSLRVAAPVSSKLTVPKLKLTTVEAGLGPLTHVTAPPGDTSRLIVVQQDGAILLVKNGELQPKPFLDLRGVVRAQGEQGLHSIAFAPDYASSGLVYAFYNNRNGNIRVAEYRRAASDPDHIDISSRRLLLSLVKPAANHNGGMLQFGPDGNLYIAIGDGGANPPAIPVGVTGQTLDDLYGGILRIDPRRGSPYAIPPGNPFSATPGARPEIVAYGLRNPWRFWIDAQTNRMLIGDVGEGAREEINALSLGRLGENFGWPCKEGTNPPPEVSIPSSCRSAKLTAPLWHYPHTAGRCSITGGVIARDPRLRQLAGYYLWADLCSGTISAIDPAAAKPIEIPLEISTKLPTSFGTDALGRIYVTTAGGSLYRIDPL